MQKKRNLSIRSILILVAIGSSSAAALASLSIYTLFMEKEFKKQAAIKTGLVSDRLASTLEYPLWYLAKNQALTILESELKDKDISRILLFGDTEDLIGTAVQKRPAEVPGLKPASREAISTSKDIIYDSSLIGKITVYADMAESRIDFRANLFSAIVLATFIAGIVSLVLFLSTDKLVTKKIMRIGAALEDFTKHNYKIRVTVAGAKEIFALARAFNSMADTIEHYNANLEEIVEDRTGKLIEAEKLALIGSLVAGVAHEVNTPLGVGITATSHAQVLNKEMIQAYRADTMSEAFFLSSLAETAEALDITFKNLRRASEFISTFKKIATDQSLEEKRNTEIKKYIEDVLLSLKPALKKHKHTISVVCPPELRAVIEPGPFYQILTNLIINSIRHGLAGREAGKISIAVDKAQNGLLLFYEDDGKGIPESIAHRIFEPFFTTTRDSGGTGLGLYIIKTIMTKQGGDVRYQAREGGGVRFIFYFPCSASLEGAVNV